MRFDLDLVITELAGDAGAGKTQLSLGLCVLTVTFSTPCPLPVSGRAADATGSGGEGKQWGNLWDDSDSGGADGSQVDDGEFSSGPPDDAIPVDERTMGVLSSDAASMPSHPSGKRRTTTLLTTTKEPPNPRRTRSGGAA